MKWLFFILLITLNAALKGQPGRQQGFNVSRSHLALQGYDPVAYFNAHRAVEGKRSLAVSYEGVTYYFSTEENKNLFKASPAQYEPRYGGWCAYAMGATGEKVDVDPQTFKIIDHQLYLFYNKFLNNTLKSWNRDEAALKTKADANWSKLNHG